MPEAIETAQASARRKPDLSEPIFSYGPNIITAESIADSSEVAPLEGLLGRRGGKPERQKTVKPKRK